MTGGARPPPLCAYTPGGRAGAALGVPAALPPFRPRRRGTMAAAPPRSRGGRSTARRRLWPGARVLVLLAVRCHAAGRDDAFVGYTEVTPTPAQLRFTNSANSPMGVACRNREGDCDGWADRGECENNAVFMAVKCARACGRCKPVKDTHVARTCGLAPGVDTAVVIDEELARGCARIRIHISEGTVRAGAPDDLDAMDVAAGSFEVALFSRHVPRTAANFERLCVRTDGGGFVGTPLHRVITDFMMQGGNTRQGSVYGGAFEDESFAFQYDEPYLLGMANGGPNTNNDQFFVTVINAPHLDNKHVVFGAVTGGFDVVERVTRLGSQGGAPAVAFRIAGCQYL